MVNRLDSKLMVKSNDRDGSGDAKRPLKDNLAKNSSDIKLEVNAQSITRLPRHEVAMTQPEIFRKVMGQSEEEIYRSADFNAFSPDSRVIYDQGPEAVASNLSYSQMSSAFKP